MTDEISSFFGKEDLTPRASKFPIFDPEAIGREFEAMVMEEVASSNFLNRPSEYRMDPKNLLLTWRRESKNKWVERTYLTKNPPGAKWPFSRLSDLEIYDGDPKSLPRGRVCKYAEDPNAERPEIIVNFDHSVSTNIIFDLEGYRLFADYSRNLLSTLEFSSPNAFNNPDYYRIAIQNGERREDLPEEILGQRVSVTSEEEGMRVRVMEGDSEVRNMFFPTNVNLEAVIRALISPDIRKNPIGAPASADTWLHANLLGLFGIQEVLPQGFGKLR